MAMKKNTNRKYKTLTAFYRSIPGPQLSEEVMLVIFDEQIRKMASKYLRMACHAVGGTREDLISALKMRLVEAYRDWVNRVHADGTYEKRNALDAVKFISPRLRTQCLDFSRYQRDHVEPGGYQLFDYVTSVDEHETPENLQKRHDVEIWNASLNDTQKQIVEIWREGNFFNRKDPIKSLVKEVKKRTNIPEKNIMLALHGLPRLEF